MAHALGNGIHNGHGTVLCCNSAHWDDFILFSGHCVHSDGFTSGRAQVTSDFSGASDGHWYSTSNYWGNTASILKTECNPDEYASNDGYVNYIDLR